MKKANLDKYKVLQEKRIWSLTKLVSEKDEVTHLALIMMLKDILKEMDKLAGIK